MALFSFSGLRKLIGLKLTPTGGDRIDAGELREVLNAMVDTTEAYANTKAQLAITYSVVETTGTATGEVNKLIVQVVGGTLTVLIYSPTATPKLQKFLTFSN